MGRDPTRELQRRKAGAFRVFTDTHMRLSGSFAYPRMPAATIRQSVFAASARMRRAGARPAERCRQNRDV